MSPSHAFLLFRIYIDHKGVFDLWTFGDVLLKGWGKLNLEFLFELDLRKVSELMT
jgi:hypothetical protein